MEASKFLWTLVRLKFFWFLDEAGLVGAIKDDPSMSFATTLEGGENYLFLASRKGGN